MDGTNTLSKKDLSPEDMKNIANLSFESYLQDSINAFKDLKSKDLEIERSGESLEDEIKLMKSQYQKLSRESVEATEIKEGFSTKVKNFFIKVWAMICDIFYKFAEIIVSLIKSLIIFIQKKRIQATSIINMMKDKGVLGLTADGRDIYEVIQQNGYKIKTFDRGGANVNKTDYAKFMDVHDQLNNVVLKQFVKSAIILKNKDSIFNIESLKKYFQQDLIGTDNPDEQKLANLELAVNYLYSQAVFYGEVSPNHKKDTDLMARYKALLDNREINKVAHMMTYEQPSARFGDIALEDFFDVSVDDRQTKFRQAWLAFCMDTKLVLDKGGYIDTLEEVLKRYKDIAKVDAQNIKEINDYIKSQLTNVTGTEDAKVEGKVKRFTNLMLNVKNIKNHFIRLRQTVILDVITLYSMENRAWYLATGKADLVNATDDPERTLAQNRTSDGMKNTVVNFDNSTVIVEEGDDPPRNK